MSEIGQCQLLRDKEIQPSQELILEGLGEASDAYKQFLSELNQHEISLMEWRYYNDGKAWLSKGEYRHTTPRGANKVKPLFWLSIWEGFFKVSFFFSEQRRAEMQNFPISQETKEIIKSAKHMGKDMEFFPIVLDVKDEKHLSDIYILANYRKEKV